MVQNASADFKVIELVNDETESGVLDRFEIEVGDDIITFEVEATDELAPYDKAAAAAGVSVDWDAMTATLINEQGSRNPGLVTPDHPDHAKWEAWVEWARGGLTS